jgi:hypothetical protein
MSCSERLAFVLPALALASGCRLHYDSIHVGGDWLPAQFETLEIDRQHRNGVLDRFGPPDELFYTLTDEVFFYRTGGHRGRDLRLLIPDPVSNLTRPGFEFIAPDREEPQEFKDDAPPVRVLQRLSGFLFGFFNPISTGEGAGLYGRRIRWNVVRLVFDRETHVLRAMEIREDIDTPATKELLRQ